MNWDIFGIIKHALKIGVVLIMLWGVVFSYIFFDFGITSNAHAKIETAAGPAEQPEAVAPEEAPYQYRPIRIKPYTKL